MAKKEKLPLDPSKELKNPRQELFCWLYAGYHNRDLFGNGKKCYMQAYGYNEKIIKLLERENELSLDKPKGYTVLIKICENRRKSLENTATNEASDTLSLPYVRARVDYLIRSYIEDEFTDQELQYTIMQRFDLQSKVQAIKEYNRMKDRGSRKLDGHFTFSWEGDTKNEKTKTPTIKKVELKKPENESEGDNVDWAV